MVRGALGMGRGCVAGSDKARADLHERDSPDRAEIDLPPQDDNYARNDYCGFHAENQIKADRRWYAGFRNAQIRDAQI